MRQYRHYFWICKCGNIYTCGYNYDGDMTGYCYCIGNGMYRIIAPNPNLDITFKAHVEQVFSGRGLKPLHEIRRMRKTSLTRKNFRIKYSELDYEDPYDEEEDDYY